MSYAPDDFEYPYLIQLLIHPQVTSQVSELQIALKGEMSRNELQIPLGLQDRNRLVLVSETRAEWGLIEMTIPEKPNSRLQNYRLTKKN